MKVSSLHISQSFPGAIISRHSWSRNDGKKHQYVPYFASEMVAKYTRVLMALGNARSSLIHFAATHRK